MALEVGLHRLTCHKWGCLNQARHAQPTFLQLLRLEPARLDSAINYEKDILQLGPCFTCRVAPGGSGLLRALYPDNETCRTTYPGDGAVGGLRLDRGTPRKLGVSEDAGVLRV